MSLKTKKLYNAATGKEEKPEGDDISAAVAAWLAKVLEIQTLIGLNCRSSIAIKLSKCTYDSTILCKVDTLYG